MPKLTKSSLFYFVLTLLAIIVMTFFGPEEATLGANVRLVYLHGAWVLTAEVLFALAALVGLAALIIRKDRLYAWTTALGRGGIFYWITYLPLSLWAMEANWNGLFLAEPRFRLAMTFAVVGLLLQLGLWLLDTKWLTALANIAFIVVLRVTFANVANVMHPPPSPIFNSGNWTIIGYFVMLNLLVWVSAFFVTRFFLPKRTANLRQSARKKISEN